MTMIPKDMNTSEYPLQKECHRDIVAEPTMTQVSDAAQMSRHTRMTAHDARQRIAEAERGIAAGEVTDHDTVIKRSYQILAMHDYQMV